MNYRYLSLVVLAVAMAGCHTDMWRQPKTEPLDISEGLFTDGASARPLVPGSIARDHLREDLIFYTGIENGAWARRIPVTVTRDLVMRGKDRFNIYCSPCHGQLGDGKGMIANRGYSLKRPVGNYHTDRLRNMPAGHFYDVITNGYGAMYSYASRVEPQDRWAIVSYIRTLQLSQHTPASQIDPSEIAKEETKKPNERIEH